MIAAHWIHQLRVTGRWFIFWDITQLCSNWSLCVETVIERVVVLMSFILPSHPPHSHHQWRWWGGRKWVKWSDCPCVQSWSLLINNVINPSNMIISAMLENIVSCINTTWHYEQSSANPGLIPTIASSRPDDLDEESIVEHQSQCNDNGHHLTPIIASPIFSFYCWS